jgi:putative ABC transport system substrate-binding protein
VRKRQFLGAFGAALAWPLAARAQAVKRIGVLIPLAESDTEAQREIAAFRDGLRGLGWTEGGNLRIDYRWSSDPARMPALAKEIVASKPDVILARSTPPTRAVLAESRSIPVVFVVVADPVGDAFVASLARPGGNLTGFTNVEGSLGGKWLELLKEIAPGTTRVAVLRDSALAVGSGQFGAIQALAPSVGVEVRPIDVRDAGEIERTITAFARAPHGGLIVTGSARAIAHGDPIIRLAAQHKLPAVYFIRRFVSGGGLISYGPDVVEQHRQAAGYVDRILKGEKPADLPVQAPTKYETVINLKTAKALGVEIPARLISLADEVIE